MAYKTKYRLQFNEFRKGTQKTVDIMEKDYTGSLTEVTGGGDPVHIRYMDGADGRDPVFEPLKKSQAAITLISTSNFQFKDMFVNATSKDYFVAIYSGPKDDEILQNRNFIGGLEEYSATSSFIWYKDTATMDNTADIGVLDQTANFPWSGTYTIKIKYSNANQTNKEQLTVEYNSATILDETLNTQSGEVEDDFVVGDGEWAELLRLSKTWFGASGTSNLRIHEISVLPKFQTTHNYNLFWKGWHQPQVYIESYLPPPYPIRLIASCGLNSLGNVDFLEKFGYYTLLQTIYECIDQMGVYLPIKINVNLYDTHTMSDGEDPFKELFSQYYNYIDEDGDVDDYLTVLKTILEPFGARMYQSNGYWVIERINNKIDSYDSYVYDWFGNERDDSFTCNDSLTLTDNTASESLLAVFSGRTQYVELEESWKNVKLVQTTGKKSIIYGDFSEKFWTSETELYFWDKLGSPDIFRDENALGYREITDGFDGSNAVKYNTYVFTTTDYDFGRHNGTFSYSARIWGGTGDKNKHAVTIPMLVYYQSGGSYYFLQNSGYWTPGTLNEPKVLTFTFEETELNEPTAWEDIEIEVFNAYKIGRLWVTLYRGYSDNAALGLGGYEIRDLKYKINTYEPFYTTNNNEQIVTEEIINEDNFTDPGEFEFKLGDLNKDIYPMPTDASTLGAYKGGLINDSTVPTGSSWAEWGVYGRKDLIHEILKDTYVNQFKFNKQVLNAIIFGGNITFDTVLLETGNDSRSFLCKTLDISLKHQTVEGSWVELYQESLDISPSPEEFEGDDFNNSEFLTD